MVDRRLSSPESLGAAAETKAIVDRLRSALEGVPGVELAVLFGSTARGEARPGSDIDVGLVLDEWSPARRASVEAALQRAAGGSVDVVDLQEACEVALLMATPCSTTPGSTKRRGTGSLTFVASSCSPPRRLVSDRPSWRELTITGGAKPGSRSRDGLLDHDEIGATSYAERLRRELSI